MTGNGGCLCGAVRYLCSEAPVQVYHCHCRDCQKASGAAFATCLVVSESAVDVTAGRPRQFNVKSAEGNTVTREFCGDCGSPLFTRAAMLPDFRIIKAGTLDDASWLKPRMHMWTSTKQPWLALGDQLRCFEKQPPVE
ncbi:MAG: GFA family protein [Deltaproteobacteria bacterium]|nr:GFA family protein [Deltaproteobacteria bacterium]